VSEGRRRGRPPIEEIGEGERREQILRAADDLFSERGYAAVSLGDVAAAVGVTKAALYHHFPSKAALYTAVMCRALGLIAAAIRATTESPGPIAEKISRLAEFPIVFLEDDADMDAMMRDADEHLSPVQRAEIAEANGARLAAMEELMHEGIERGELRRISSPVPGARLLAPPRWLRRSAPRVGGDPRHAGDGEDGCRPVSFTAARPIGPLRNRAPPWGEEQRSIGFAARNYTTNQ
jgi:AcrR family transcriptional regulator